MPFELYPYFSYANKVGRVAVIGKDNYCRAAFEKMAETGLALRGKDILVLSRMLQYHCNNFSSALLTDLQPWSLPSSCSLRRWNRERHHHHPHRTRHGHNDSCHRPLGNEHQGRQQHHRRHHPDRARLLLPRHAAALPVAAHILTHPRPQQPRLEARRAPHEQPRRQQHERRRRQPRHHHSHHPQPHGQQPQGYVDRFLHLSL